MPSACRKRRASRTSSDVRVYDRFKKSISNSAPSACDHEDGRPGPGRGGAGGVSHLGGLGPGRGRGQKGPGSM
jgi:hypothetical protein